MENTSANKDREWKGTHVFTLTLMDNWTDVHTKMHNVCVFVCVCEVGRKLRSVDKFPQISGQEREVSWVKVTDTKKKKEGKEGRLH